MIRSIVFSTFKGIFDNIISVELKVDGEPVVFRTLFSKFSDKQTYHGEGLFEKQKKSNQKRIQNPAKHLRWSVLRK